MQLTRKATTLSQDEKDFSLSLILNAQYHLKQHRNTKYTDYIGDYLALEVLKIQKQIVERGK